MNPYTFKLDKMSDDVEPKDDLTYLHSIVLLKFNLRVKFGWVLVLGYGYVSKTLWNCTICALSICNNIPMRVMI